MHVTYLGVRGNSNSYKDLGMMTLVAELLHDGPSLLGEIEFEQGMVARRAECKCVSWGCHQLDSDSTPQRLGAEFTTVQYFEGLGRLAGFLQSRNELRLRGQAFATPSGM